jgi:hypothetical protein
MRLSRAVCAASIFLLLLSIPRSVPAQHAGATVNRDSSAVALEGDLDQCRPQRVTGFPGSGQFASDFIEAFATDPAANTSDAGVLWALTADLSDAVPADRRALYISRSGDGGAAWTQVARIDSRYIDARLGEGLRNGFAVGPGATYFVVTTQRGAFQVIPQPNASEPIIIPIDGPRVPSTPPKVFIAKRPGDRVRANVVAITPDGKRMIIGYGYFDLDPKILVYHTDDNGTWIDDGPLPPPPTEMDLLSIAFDDPQNPNPGFIYVGTGDQVYALNRRSRRWSRIDGVGPDSAIHGMSVVHGLHLAACWGVYNPAGPGMVRRVTRDDFLLHRGEDDAGSNVRAYSVDVDPLRPDRDVITSLTGVYISEDKGDTWKRINDLPDEEFRSSHINADGSLVVSGIAGTFLLDPFSDACSPHLKPRKR